MLAPEKPKNGEMPAARQHNRHRPKVEVRAMRDEEDQRVLAVKRAQPGQLLIVGDDVVTAQQPTPEPVPRLRHELFMRGGDLAEMADRLLEHGRVVSAELPGELANALVEPRGRAHRVDLGRVSPPEGIHREVAGQARRARPTLRELPEGPRNRASSRCQDAAHSTCSVGRTTISLTATRRGLVTMYSTASATSAGWRRSIPARARSRACTSMRR